MMANKYNMNYDNIAHLKKENLNKVAVGEIKKDPSASGDIDNLRMRLMPLVSPYGNYSDYLKEALIQELEEAKLLDPSSNIEIRAYILKNEISTGISDGLSEIEVRFLVFKNNKQVYESLKAAQNTWPSSFFGAVAAAAAKENYSVIYNKVIGSLFSDIGFINAIKN